MPTVSERLLVFLSVLAAGRVKFLVAVVICSVLRENRDLQVHVATKDVHSAL
jgi:hypothetical protein